VHVALADALAGGFAAEGPAGAGSRQGANAISAFDLVAMP